MKDVTNEYLLLAALRHCIALRDSLNADGFGDESGALVSVEHLLDLLSVKRKYGISKVIEMKSYPYAERTIGVTYAINAGNPIRVEHVNQTRAWTLSFIKEVHSGLSDDELLGFIDNNYRLILVTLLQSRALRCHYVTGIGIERFDYIGLRIDSMHNYLSFSNKYSIH